MNWLDTLKWDAQGLLPAIAQEQGSGVNFQILTGMPRAAMRALACATVNSP